jgi:hypothetical protein
VERNYRKEESHDWLGREIFPPGTMIGPSSSSLERKTCGKIAICFTKRMSKRENTKSEKRKSCRTVRIQKVKYAKTKAMIIRT